MTIQDFKKTTTAKLSNLNINELKEVVESLSDKFDEISDIITQIALDLLSEIMEENEFELFCDAY